MIESYLISGAKILRVESPFWAFHFGCIIYMNGMEGQHGPEMEGMEWNDPQWNGRNGMDEWNGMKEGMDGMNGGQTILPR